MLSLLWDCGLSVTLQIRLCQTVKDLLVARNLQSEAVKTLGHSAMSDSFLSFAKIIKTLSIEKVQEGVDLGLYYNGSAYNAAMHKAAVSLASLLGPNSEVEKALSSLELLFGRETLSSEYSKLSKLMAVARAQVQPQGPRPTVPDLVAWLVQLLTLTFRMQVPLPSKATEKWLDRDRKSGKAGFWHAGCFVLQACGGCK